MTKLLDSLDLIYTGQRYAHLEPISWSAKVQSEKLRDSNQHEVRAEVRIGAMATTPGYAGSEKDNVVRSLRHMLAKAIYGEVVDDLHLLIAEAGKLECQEIRERLASIVRKMEP